ncbi:kinesin-like protein KIN-12E [Pistacia vera]|uniref:kinesin-like protein KIN-12E n=2 Tax=Pistacia vera TaxID=55513 RepID=UPI001262F6F2|nr:kinesin-like protein KIN-12E [Pistacia vera]
MKEPVIPWRSSINEENEFLRVQAIQNQAEMEALQKKLEFCLKEKEKLESNVRELVQKLQEETSSREMNEEKQHIGLSTLPTNLPIIDFNDQMELKTMVDAIATASQREAEAHQTAIMLSKQNNEQRLRLEILNEEKIELNKLNDELRLKLKVLIEEKSKLIELYERAAAESNSNTQNTVELAQGGMEEENSGYLDELAQEKEVEMKKVIENLEHQLMEMHEENEKLLGMYEKAMQERDELRRTISLSGQNSAEVKGEFDCPEKLVEVDGGEHIASDGLGLPVSKGQDSGENPTMSGQVISLVGMHDVEVTFADMEIEPMKFPKEVSEDINLVREKLGKAQEKLSDSANTVTLFGSVEKAFAEVDKLSREIKAMEESVEVKQQHLGSLKLVFNEMQERKALLDKKLLALKYSLSNFSSSVAYFEQREARSRARVTASLTYLNQKKEEAGHLQACKSEIEAAIKRVQRSEVELRSNLALVKSKLEEENKRQENEKVLFAIDNIEKIDHSQKNWHLGGKATELLKSEEEKTKLQNEMKLSRERLGVVKREFEDLTKKSWKIESDLQTVQMEVQKSSRSTEEMELALQAVTQEKETLLEIREKGKSEIESMILEYQQQVFEADLKEAEMKVLEEELNSQLRRLEELQKVRAAAAEKNSKIFDQTKSHSCLISGKVEEELKSAWGYIQEARILLGQEQLIDS